MPAIDQIWNRFDRRRASTSVAAYGPQMGPADEEAAT
jgi:hypothetical protein